MTNVTETTIHIATSNPSNLPLSAAAPQTTGDTALTEPAFAAFGLAQAIQRALDAAGYVTPTPIQAGAIPALMDGRDMLGIAQTGTGKTAAFALPILHRLSSDPLRPARKTARALILAPTRELALQIGDSIRLYGKNIRLTSATIFGGVSESGQIKAMAPGVDILVATPGRLLDLAQRGYVDLRATGIFVLDEADRMLDMGFIRDVNKIVAMLPAERQSLLFSATMPKEIAHLAHRLLRNPIRVEVTPEVVTVDRIDQHVYFIDNKLKRPLLVSLLQDAALARVVVFTRTKHVANRVADYVNAAGITADAIHGNKSQNARQKALENFKRGHVRVLVATDIAARGIHVSDVSHVINYDLPNIPETYVHRIGRTARAGAEGIALSFCDPTERGYLKDIERLIKRALTVAPYTLDHRSAAATPDNDRRSPRDERQRQGDRRVRRHDEPGERVRVANPPSKNKRPPRHHPQNAQHGQRPERPGSDGHNRHNRPDDHAPRTRAEANMAHAERYFGGGRSPHHQGHAQSAWQGDDAGSGSKPARRPGANEPGHGHRRDHQPRRRRNRA